ncbi:MAG: hypothetical protein EU549_04850 [Promethearchaeota archaeon]|nr:MAG: hypothetical protein EU549_04850 [Candidatus Lokiarchaeota archaeon]
MEYFKKIFKESLVIIILSSIMGLLSGMVLSLNQKILYTIPIILLILPSLNSLIGDISTILVSRLTSHLYVGIIPPKFEKSKRIIDDLIGLFLTILLSLIVLILFGYLLGIATGIEIVNPFLITFIIILTILFLFAVLSVLLFISSIFIFRRGGDPNNFLIPFITSLADFLTPLLLIIFLIIFI